MTDLYLERLDGTGLKWRAAREDEVTALAERLFIEMVRRTPINHEEVREPEQQIADMARGAFLEAEIFYAVYARRGLS